MILFVRALALGAVLAATASATATFAGTPKKAAPRQELLQRFDRLTPADRLKLIEANTKSAKEFHTVAPDDVVTTVVARGSLVPAKASDIFCTVRSGARGALAATVIKFVVEDGTVVKKGDLIAQLDESGLVDQLKDQRAKVDLARTEWMRVKDDRAVQRQDDEAAILDAEITLRSARLNLKRNVGDDADEIDLLKLQVERARLGLARTKALLKSRAVLAEAELQAKIAIVDAEQGRLREIEEQIQACRLVAPNDGLLIYYTPESKGIGSQTVVAPGEPVREGQKLLQVCDLSRMLLVLRVPETLVGQLRKDQKAIARVDAFPHKSCAGHVQEIAPVAAVVDWFATDVKVYPVKVALAGDLAGLKPGMSAEASIETGRADGVLWLPAQAVLRAGIAHCCYVRAGNEVRKTDVTTGLRNDLRVEIKAGLQPGDMVLRDPVGLLRRLSPMLIPATGADAGHPSPLVQVQSAHAAEPDSSAKRSWVDRYGLTYRDLHAIAALPTIAAAVPVRRLPQSFRRLEHTLEGTLVATTPALAEVQSLPLSAGRYLMADDEAERRNVVVLGATAADALFPDTDAVGNTVVVNRESFVVIGVLEEAVDQARDNSVFMPLSTYRSRFGERVIIRAGAKRHAESVQISEILLLPQSAQEVRSTVESVRGILTEYHDRQDWTIQADR